VNALIPLNVAALRVNANDFTSIVDGFAGRTAVFEQIPYAPKTKPNQGASTGDTISRPLESGDSPIDPLGIGIHLHWELPDYYRRGSQPANGAAVTFPHAPDRWLVIRHLRTSGTTLGPLQTKAWIVESDYLSPTLLADAQSVIRPAVSVPLTAKGTTQPYLYMGRVVEYESWNPAGETPANYLPAYTGADGDPLYLTATGFVGPAFASYYPDCCSVFGFWDHFKDLPAVYQAITQNLATQFEVTYQVFGWVQDATYDPLAGIQAAAIRQYDAYVAQCAQENVAVAQTPADVFVSVAQHHLRWTFDAAEIPYTLNTDKTVDTLGSPASALCSGIVQDVVWNMGTDPQSYFLASDQAGDPSQWTGQVELAVGNTTAEALSAILKHDLDPGGGGGDKLADYEYLLDALQLGQLRDLDQKTTKVVSLEEALHSSGFSKLDGGYVWVVRQPMVGGEESGTDQEVTLPLDLAEQLSVLNLAQKSYDQGRAALVTMRQQLFMDWIRYAKMYAGGQTDPNVLTNALAAFLSSSESGELNAVVSAGTATGILQYGGDPQTQEVVSIAQPAGTTSLAAQVWTAYAAMSAALAPFPSWVLRAEPAAPFWMPADPVVLMEGDRVQPVRRNGTSGSLAPRLSAQVLGELGIAYEQSTFVLAASAIQGIPAIASTTPMQTDVAALAAETFLLAPMLADLAATALAAQGGDANPATADLAGFTASLRAAQGGSSPLDAFTPSAGLFEAVRDPAYVPAANPVRAVTAPLAIRFTFTNAATDGWAPDPIGWTAQHGLTGFPASRVDPFLPVSLVWALQLDAFQPGGTNGYAAGDLTATFALDPDGVDYVYSPGASFVQQGALTYDSSVVLSRKPVFSLTAQIDDYERMYPTDPEDPTLDTISAAYKSRNIVSQALSGFNVEQTLRAYVPQIPVEDLVMGGRDAVTHAIATAANADQDDDWYDFGFNAQAPIATGLLAQYNFGPLRAGFAEIATLSVVDAFGQTMALQTPLNADGTLQATPALTLAPIAGDTAHVTTAYLPPRLLVPTRLWFNWLSASHDLGVTGVTSDFVETSTHPATSPVCGWILPNHLENTLFFYDADGSPIGSFGIEHGTLQYRTRPGNLANMGDMLALDIGEPGTPLVNPHAAAFMWYLDGRDAAFLADLMTTILASEPFISPSGAAQSQSLSVLIGRPLAIGRAVIGLETRGGLLPLSQADTSSADPFPQAVAQQAFDYSARQAIAAANLGDVLFPVRLGDLANVDDGLVGFLIEGDGSAPYSTLYAPAAPPGATNGVERPTPETLQLTLNDDPVVVTFLLDPRAAIHATTGVLPVAGLEIPPDQYLKTMQRLEISFSVLPILGLRTGLRVPLPLESGYEWSWIAPGAAPVPQAPNAVGENAIGGYSPQTIHEGWVQLSPGPAVP
jgi:hypothetical protein